MKHMIPIIGRRRHLRGIMATFEQGRQHIGGNQYNADNITVGDPATEARRQLLENLIADLQRGIYGSNVVAVTQHVEAARAAVAAGNPTVARTWLDRAAIAAAPVAALAASVAQIVQSF